MKQSPAWIVPALGVVGALLTGAASATPWFYETFVSREFQLEYKVNGPVNVDLSTGPLSIWQIDIKNGGRKPVTQVVVLLPKGISDAHANVPPGIKSTQAETDNIEIERLLPDDVVHLTATSDKKELEEDFIVRSNESIGRPIKEFNYRQQTIVSAIAVVIVSLAYSAIAYAIFRKRWPLALSNANTILLVASVFSQDRLMRTVWEARSIMLYRGAAELVFIDIQKAPTEDGCKALLALCVDPDMPAPERDEISVLLADVTHLKPDAIERGLIKTRATTGKRSDIHDAVWNIRRASLPDIFGQPLSLGSRNS